MIINNNSTGDVSISGDADFHGAINSPFSNFIVSGGSDFFGAVIANESTLSGTGAVHYDESIGTAFNKFKITNWQHLM